jgi:probable F420-dependent oxidoreductase
VPTDAAALGHVGVWSTGLRTVEGAEAADAAAEVEALGYGAIWIPGRAGGDVFGAAGHLLAATRALVVATGIVNLWMHTPAEVAEACGRLGDRFLLGLGVSHGPPVAASGQTYERPLAVTAAYLDALDGLGVGAGARVLAALGPRMLALARERSLGAHPYLVTPEHTAAARQVLGPDRLLAPEQHVVRATDPATARALARRVVANNLRLPNYRASFTRLGFTDADLDHDGSDRLIDAVVAWGADEAIARRVRDHLDAGADHVALQVLTGDPAELPLAGWRALAPLLTST